jgi:hypothetical protein
MSSIRVFLAATLLVPQLAAADLYRWVDPQSGSVKFSNAPPPWYETDRGPPVERIPYQGPAARTAGAEKPAAGGSTLAALEARWLESLRTLAEASAKGDPGAPTEAMKRQLEVFQAITAELDRLDPGGRDRRRAEQLSLLQKLQK